MDVGRMNERVMHFRKLQVQLSMKEEEGTLLDRQMAEEAAVRLMSKFEAFETYLVEVKNGMAKAREEGTAAEVRRAGAPHDGQRCGQEVRKGASRRLRGRS